MRNHTVPVFDPLLNCYRYRLRCGNDLLIDEQDLWLLSIARWKSGNHGHVRAHFDLHRLVMKAQTGQQVDHIHGNRLDCRKSELRFCTGSQNCARRGKQIVSRSRFKGVYYDRRTSRGIRKSKKRRWAAVMKVAGKLQCFGRFFSEEEAARCYDENAKRLYGEFAMTNAELCLYADSLPRQPRPFTDDERYLMNNGVEALIDPEDRWMAECAAWKPHYKKQYPSATVEIHRLIMRAKPGELIDHVRGNPLDNRRCMLRRCTQMQNGKNRLKQRQASYSKFKGVSFDIQLFRKGRAACWSAQICVNYRLVKLGRFTNQEDAARRYDQAAREHFGDFPW